MALDMKPPERGGTGISLASITSCTGYITGLALSALLCLLYFLALPRPLPGIPHNKLSARSPLGEWRELSHVKCRREWIWHQPSRLGAPLVQLFLFPFKRPTVVVSDYHAVVDIMRRTKEFDRGVQSRDRMGLLAPTFHFLLQSRDPRFFHHRGLIKDLMSPKFLREVSAPRIYQNVLTLVDLWTLKAGITRGRPFPAGHDLHLATLDIICGVAFSMEEERSALRSQIRHVQTSTQSVPFMSPLDPVEFPSAAVDPELEALLDLPRMVSIAHRSPFPRLSSFLALLLPKHARFQRSRHELIRRQTDLSLKRMAKGPDACESALDHLLWREVAAAEKTGRQPDVYSPDIRDELIGYLLAGHDSTATVSSWFIKYISRDPLIQTRLRDELRLAHPVALLERRPPSHGEICTATVPYLDAVVEETLRHASVAGLAVRIAVRDTHVMGYAIPRGTEILLPLTGPSLTEPALPFAFDFDFDHDPPPPQTAENGENAEKVGQGPPSWGDDVSEFKPERWMKSQNRESQQSQETVFDGNAGPTLPFGTGPRSCFGKRLALMEMKILMTLLLWHFEMEHVGEALDSDEVLEVMARQPKMCYAKLKRIGY